MSEQRKNLSIDELHVFMCRFNAHMDKFIKSGDRISFGRLEGMKDVAEAFGWANALTRIEHEIRRHDKELSAWCGD